MSIKPTTAGTAPMNRIKLKPIGVKGAEEIVGREENVVFALPRELRATLRQ